MGGKRLQPLDPASLLGLEQRLADRLEQCLAAAFGQARRRTATLFAWANRLRCSMSRIEPAACSRDAPRRSSTASASETPREPRSLLA